MTDPTCSNDKFEILDHSPLGMFIIRYDYNVVFWNRCMEDWSGIRREEILGSDLRHHYPHLKEDKYRLRIDPIFSGGAPAIFSSQLHKNLIPIRLRGGSFQVQHTKVTALPSLSEEGTHALFVIEDVTELTKSIHDYRRMREQALLENEQRKKTLEQLKKANLKILEQQETIVEEERRKVLLEMAGATAHELSQPITSLLGSIELIRMCQEVPERIRMHMERINDAGRRISEVIRKIQAIRHYDVTSHDHLTRIINLHQALNILYIVKSDEDFHKVKQTLSSEKSISLSREDTLQEGLRVLKQQDRKPFDLVFADHVFEDGTCFELMQYLEENSPMPLVIITRHDDESLAVQLLKSGASEYLTIHQINPEILLKVIHQSIEKQQLKMDLARLQASLKNPSHQRPAGRVV